MHVNGRWVRLDPQQVRSTLERLHRHREQLEEIDVAGLLRLAAESAGAADDGRGGSTAPITVAGEGWIGDLLAGLPDDRLVETTEPDGFTGTLRHYQRAGLSWMQFLARLGLGGCLADDMGLGKTATTLAHLATRPGPHLVVCPLSVVHNWRAEAARFTPHLGVVDPPRRRADAHLDGARGGAARGRRRLARAHRHRGHHVRLARSRRRPARRGRLGHDRARRGTGGEEPPHPRRQGGAPAPGRADAARSTGTPVENHLGELWSILDAVNPGLLGSAKQFNDRYAKPIQREPRRGRHRGAARPDAAVRAPAHEGRQDPAPRAARQDRADRLGHAHQGAGGDVPGGGRPADRGRAGGAGHAPPRARARRADPAEADLQPPRARGRATARGSPGAPAS